jgi:hypothetical protein
MNASLRAAVAALAAVLGFGLFAVAQSATASGDDLVPARQDSVAVLSGDDSGGGPGDDDGDDGDDDGHEPDDDRTGVSNDGTNSRHTRVSQDRDVSNGDLTKDRTMDGGDPTRDHTRNHTNDRTRNDTR